jgi:hypothetical protein
MKVRKLRQWRLIVDTFHDGFMNMSRDESIMRGSGGGLATAYSPIVWMASLLPIIGLWATDC